MVRAWCLAHRDELLAADGPNVQSEADMLAGLSERTAMTHDAARAAYRAWTAPILGPIPSRHHAPGHRPSAQ